MPSRSGSEPSPAALPATAGRGLGGPLVLASASPQRTAILAALGVAHTVRPADVDEVVSGDPREVARANARAKARAVAVGRPAGTLVLGADTVVLDPHGAPLGKPRDRDEAARMLDGHAGRTHLVRSAACLVRAGARQETTVDDAAEVGFRPLPTARRDWYLDTNEWRGRAGAYAIQGRGGLLVTGVRGDWWTVVGLPVAALAAAAPALFGVPAAG